MESNQDMSHLLFKMLAVRNHFNFNVIEDIWKYNCGMHNVFTTDITGKVTKHYAPWYKHTLLCIAAQSYHNLLSDGIDTLGKDKDVQPRKLMSLKWIEHCVHQSSWEVLASNWF